MFEATRCLCIALLACAGVLACASSAVAQTSTQAVATPTAAPFSNYIPTLTRKPTTASSVAAKTAPAALPSPSASIPTNSTVSTTTLAKKGANTGEIYRWIDKNGKVQYSADVPEDRRATAKKVDTRSNIVSSRVPASIQGAPAPEPSQASSAVRKPVTEREKCEAAWQVYRAAEACFAQYRQSTAGGAGNKAGSRVSSEAQQTCPALIEPAACR